MKFFACVCLIGLLAGAVAGSDAEMDHYEEAQDAVEMEEEADPARFGRAAYAAPSYASAKSYGGSHHEAVYPGPAHTYSYGSPAPKVPCGKHLLFSCQPSVAPVPCVAPKYSAPAYSGAYSEQVPVYMYPNPAY